MLPAEDGESLPATAGAAIVEQDRVAFTPEGADRVRVKTALVLPELPSTIDVLAMVMDGTASSLVMVPVAWDWDRVAPAGLDRVRVSVSLNSYRVSPLTG